MPIPGNAEIPLIAYWSGNPTNALVSEIDVPPGTVVIDYTTPALWLKVSALGSNATYIGGGASTLTAPLISGGLTASGSASNDFSGSTGTMKTSTGLFTVSGAENGSTQALSGAGAVNVTTGTTKFTSTGSAQALSLADGADGQLKRIIHVVDGGSGVLTPTTKTGFSTLTFTNAGDSATLEFVTTQGWCVLALNGTTLA